MIEHEIPKGWKIKPLKELCDLFNGAAFKSTDYVGNATDTLLIRMGNIRPNAKFDPLYKVTFLPDEYAKRFSSYILKDGDLIIAMTDMATETKILGVPTVVHVPKGKTLLLNQRVGKLIINAPNELDFKYIQLYLTSTYANNHYKSLGKGGVQINLSKNDVLSVNVILPTTVQQKQIVDKIERLFSELDEGVNILQILKQQIKVLRQSILKVAFSDKLTSYYVSDGELPEEWALKKLDEIILDFKRGPFGSAIKKDFFVENGYKVYEQRNAIYKSYSMGNYYINKDKFVELRSFEVIAGDFIISCSGTIGKIYQIPENAPPGIINQALLRLKINNQLLNNKFFYFLFEAAFFQSHIIQTSKGVAIKNMASVKEMKKIEVLIPTIQIQKQIVAKIEGLFATCNELDQTIDNALNQAQLLRQSILKQAFSGKLVKNNF